MGRTPQAVLDHREDARRYYKKHREERLAYQKEYNNAHKEEISARGKARREAHPIIHSRKKKEDYRRNIEKRRRTNKLYSAKNKERKAAASRAWRLAHPRKAKALRIKSKHDYRARLHGALGSFTGKEFQDLCQKFGHSCIGCGKSKRSLKSINRILVPDHITPLVLGGANVIENIQPLCHPMLGGRGGCNSSKRAEEIDFRNTPLAISLLKKAA